MALGMNFVGIMNRIYETHRSLQEKSNCMNMLSTIKRKLKPLGYIKRKECFKNVIHFELTEARVAKKK